MRYLHTNDDPKEMDYIIPGNDGDNTTRNNSQSNLEEIDYVIPCYDGEYYIGSTKETSKIDEVIPVEDKENKSNDDLIIFDDDEVDKTLGGTIKFVFSGLGLLLGAGALGVGLSGSLKGTEKSLTLIAGAGLTSFSLVKTVKNVLTITGMESEDNKSLVKRNIKE